MLHNGKIINVVDGDTYDCIVDLDFYMTIKIRIRIFGVNCPEMSHKSSAGAAAKKFSEERLLNQDVTLDFIKYDGFGRCLCELWIGTENFAEILVKEGQAVEYLP